MKNSILVFFIIVSFETFAQEFFEGQITYATTVKNKTMTIPEKQLASTFGSIHKFS